MARKLLVRVRNAEGKMIEKEGDSPFNSVSFIFSFEFNNMPNKDYMAQLNACKPNIVCIFAQGQLTSC